MSEAPPTYYEVPCEDHAAQLEQMKAMMEQMRLEKEQMRLDKERLEKEAKRYEMEVKEKKELAVVFSLFRDEPHAWFPSEKGMEYAFNNAGEEESKFLRSLEASGETILLAHVDYSVRGCAAGHRKPQSGVLRFVLTNCHLYDCVYKWVKHPASPAKCEHCKSDNCAFLKLGTFHASALYSFTNPLNLVHTKILSSIMITPTMGGGPTHPGQSLWRRVVHALASTRDGLSGDKAQSDALKKFETIIRLIPGSYKNGSWRQLDGFFGMYFNETTMEVSEVPPL